MDNVCSTPCLLLWLTMTVNNLSNRVQYFNKKSLKIIDDDYNISLSDISEESIIAHENNATQFVYRPDIYNEIIKGIIPIPPHTQWQYDTIQKTWISKNEMQGSSKKWNKSHLLTLIEGIITKIRNKNIAVQFSGGLDSSIIIGVLNHFGIFPLLIGMRNNRYEFRTERIIQDKIALKNKNVIYLDDEQYLPFSFLNEVPKHFLPSTSSLFCSAELAMAKICKSHNVDIFFNGMGFDTILTLEPNEANKKHWHPWMFDNNWFADYIYSPNNICFRSGVYSNALVSAIWNLRQGEAEDNSKKWARKFFKEFIPYELSAFQYKGDNIGLFIDGVTNSLNAIYDLFDYTFKMTQLKQFSYLEYKKLFSDYHLNEDAIIKKIMARVSFAVWLYGKTTNSQENIPEIFNSAFAPR